MREPTRVKVMPASETEEVDRRERKLRANEGQDELKSEPKSGEDPEIVSAEDKVENQEVSSEVENESEEIINDFLTSISPEEKKLLYDKLCAEYGPKEDVMEHGK